MSSPSGNNAIPVVITTDPPNGCAAIPVWGYVGYPDDCGVIGGRAVRVYVVSDAELKQNGGQFYVQGRPSPMPIFSPPDGDYLEEGNVPIPVYPLNEWP